MTNLHEALEHAKHQVEAQQPGADGGATAVRRGRGECLRRSWMEKPSEGVRWRVDIRGMELKPHALQVGNSLKRRPVRGGLMLGG